MGCNKLESSRLFRCGAVVEIPHFPVFSVGPGQVQPLQGQDAVMPLLDIEKGHYGVLALEGLHLAGAHGKNGEVWYLDDRATPEQSRALKLIAAHIRTRKNSYFETAHIVQEVGERGNRVVVGDKGGFDADYILGGD